MASRKRTEYQNTIYADLIDIIGQRPDFADLKADGRLRLKFCYRGRWVNRLHKLVRTSALDGKRNRIKAYIRLEAPNVEQDTYTSSMLWYSGDVFYIPPSKDWVKPKVRKRTPYQIMMLDKLMTTWRDPKTKVKRKERILGRSPAMFNPVDNNDQRLLIEFNHYEEELATHNRLAVMVDWCRETDMEVTWGRNGNQSKFLCVWIKPN